jgi:drug/metabolite transporter (DMT)-like permease
VDDRPTNPAPGEQRPRALDRPPSDRYRTDHEAQAEAPERPPFGRGIAAALVAAVAGAIAIAVGGGLLTMTAGLLVVAAIVGWIVAVALMLGAGPASARERARRRWIAAAIALGGVALGQAGLWLIAREEGGTLGAVDYLSEVFGLLVPAQLLIAAAVAWWRAA